MRKHLYRITSLLLIVALLGAFALPSFAANYIPGTYKITAKSGSNVRSGPSTGYSVVTAVPNGKQVTVTEVSGSWGKITYNNRTGWVYLYYAKLISSAPASTTVSYKAKVTTASAPLRMRSGPDTSYSTITTIPRGKTVTVTAESNGFARVTYNGKTGWCSVQYLTKVNTTSSSSSSSTTSSATGAYRSWKQYDSSWGSVKIGTKTIKQVGCAATSVAMLIVHAGLRSEKNFNPGIFVNEMKKVNGFANNDIYWAKAEQVVPGFSYSKCITLKGDADDKLATIQKYADQGYYIIVSVKNCGHWVAVDSVTSTKVKMMDPGSSSTDLFAKYAASGMTQLRLYKAG